MIKNDSTDEVINEYQKKFDRLKKENEVMRGQRDESE
jgi:hypothetical protein